MRTRTLEAYAKHYTMAWPFEEHDSGRPCRVSPLYDRLLAAGRVLRREAGVGAPELVRRRRRRRDSHTTSTATAGRTGSTPSDASTALIREAAGLIDQTSFAKFALKGPDSLAALELDLRQRRRQAGRLADVHADARRPRRHPVRPHRVPRGRPTSSTSSPAPASPRTTSTGSNATSRQGPNAQLFDITSAQLGAGADGTAPREHPAGGHRRRRVERRRSRSARMRIDRASPAAGSTRCASRTSASSGGSCTCPIEYAVTVYDALMAAGAPLGSGQRRLPGDRELPAREGLPRHGAATSVPTTRRSRPGSAGR